jgi:hypothetical protein
MLEPAGSDKDVRRIIQTSLRVQPQQIRMRHIEIDLAQKIKRDGKYGVKTRKTKSNLLNDRNDMIGWLVHLLCCKICLHVALMMSLPERSCTEPTSSACLKYSSFLRWDSTSTLVTANEMSFNVNRHGLGNNRILCVHSQIEPTEQNGRRKDSLDRRRKIQYQVQIVERRRVRL